MDLNDLIERVNFIDPLTDSQLIDMLERLVDVGIGKCGRQFLIKMVAHSLYELEVNDEEIGSFLDI